MLFSIRCHLTRIHTRIPWHISPHNSIEKELRDKTIVRESKPIQARKRSRRKTRTILISAISCNTCAIYNLIVLSQFNSIRGTKKKKCSCRRQTTNVSCYSLNAISFECFGLMLCFFGVERMRESFSRCQCTLAEFYRLERIFMSVYVHLNGAKCLPLKYDRCQRIRITLYMWATARFGICV